MNSFFRCPFLIVGMRPGTLLTQVHLRILVAIQAGPFSHTTESMHVEGGCAGRYDEAIQPGGSNVVNHLLLCRIRTGEHVSPGNDNAGFRGDLFPDLFHIYIV
jgi:hypothetical protein